MLKATDLEILMIATVRADKEVGRGTCSAIDECFSDDELLAFFREKHAKDPAGAVKVARDHETAFRGREAEVRAEAF